MTDITRAPLAVLGSAIALTAAGSADATLISTAGSGFTPVTITNGSSATYNIDLDGNGTTDFTLLSDYRYPTDTTKSLLLETGAAANAVQSFAGTLTGTTDPSTLSITNVKTDSPVTISDMGTTATNNHAFVSGTPTYAALALNTSSVGPFVTTGTLGYLEGVYTAASGRTPSSFKLLDFGLVSSAAPEPASWVMMIAGFGGIGALRRRARAEAASRAAC